MLGIIIQARVGSTRLPGKMTLPFYDGQTIPEILIARLSSAFDDIPVILATTSNQSDDALQQIAEQKGIVCFRGDEQNVLKRFIDAADDFDIDQIVRVCADNPFLDMTYLKMLLDSWDSSAFSYASFCLPDGTPVMRSHLGLFAECMTRDALKKVSEYTTDSLYLEHVSNYIYSNPAKFPCQWLRVPEEAMELPNMRLTLDTPVDFEILSSLFSSMRLDGLPISVSNINATLKRKPEWLASMAAQIQAQAK
jgi:spore coat polysaccharide biosynthesis protein SpsF